MSEDIKSVKPKSENLKYEDEKSGDSQTISYLIE